MIGKNIRGEKAKVLFLNFSAVSSGVGWEARRGASGATNALGVLSMVEEAGGGKEGGREGGGYVI